MSKDIKKTIEAKYKASGMYTKGDEIRYVDFKFPSGTFIIGNNVVNIMSDKVVTCIDIKSKQNTLRYKEFFNKLWRKE